MHAKGFINTFQGLLLEMSCEDVQLHYEMIMKRRDELRTIDEWFHNEWPALKDDFLNERINPILVMNAIERYRRKLQWMNPNWYCYYRKHEVEELENDWDGYYDGILRRMASNARASINS